jgi:hypothetical protein
MKKSIFSILFVALLITLFATSCNETEEISSLKKENSQEQLENLTNLYIAKTVSQNNKPSSQLPQVQRRPWHTILSFDVGGALAGLGFFGPIGGLIGGALASGLAAVEINPDQPIDYNGNGTAYASAKVNNDYDGVGYYHYYMINSASVSTQNYLDANGKFSVQSFRSFAGNLLVNEEVITQQKLSNFTTQNLNYQISYLQNNMTNGLTGLLTTLYNDNKISLEAKNFLSPYFQALETTTDVDAFINYSENAEDIVIASSLNSIDKQVILSTMATARYGVHYWGR